METHESNAIQQWLEQAVQEQRFAPLSFYRKSLYESLYEAVSQVNLDKGISNEKLYRLRWFNDFTAFQLEQLIEEDAQWFHAPTFVSNYIQRLKSLKAFESSSLPEADLLALVSQNPLVVKSLRVIHQDASDTFEGIGIELAKETLDEAGTMGLIKDLAKYYKVSMPRRINRELMIEILVRRLHLNDEEVQALNDMTVLELEGYAKDKKAHVSIELKKREMIEYLVEQWLDSTPRLEGYFDDIVPLSLIEDDHHQAVFEKFTVLYDTHVRRKKIKRLSVSFVVFALIAAYVVIDFLDLIELPVSLF
jgi:hypothetical protein